MHPSVVLFKESNKAVALPICDHYAGSKIMRKQQHEYRFN